MAKRVESEYGSVRKYERRIALNLLESCEPRDATIHALVRAIPRLSLGSQKLLAVRTNLALSKDD